MNETIFSIEYNFNNISASLLWEYIHTPDGLSTWFADKVSINGKSYTFSWNGEKRDATQISIKNGVSLKLRWDDEEFKKHYFEFKITSNELTKDTTLIITDFANGEEHDDLINLWNEQVSILRKKLGA